jgi:arylsulfatase A-like enzyme
MELTQTFHLLEFGVLMKSFFCFCLVFAGLDANLFATDPEKPNILFIAIDDQNDWIGCLGGHPQVKTPHIDRLASRGTLFTNAHCQSPLCNSSRTSLMTGLRPSTTGIYGLAPWFRNVEEFKERVSLPQYLKSRGYRTLTTGKIYHGGSGRRKTDNEFDVIGVPPGVGIRPQQPLIQDTNHPLVDWGVFPHRDQDKGDWKVAQWAVEQLKAKHKEPLFLSVGFFLPHVPCYATQKWFDLYPEDSLIMPPYLKGDRDDTPRFSWYLHWKLPEPRLDFLQEKKQWKNLVRSYLACTSFVDDQVGRVLVALEKSGLQDNTMIVLWSDHGWHLGEKRITGKNTLWERSTRVPLIFAGPGVVANAVCDQPAELLDIYPTLVDLTGGTPGELSLEGLSLKPQLTGNREPRRPAITTHNHDNHVIRTQRWRYISYADQSEELYDMKSDPNEWNNLAGNAKYRQRMDSMKQWLPKTNKKPAKGSRSRILTFDGLNATWEGKKIPPDAEIPKINLTPGKR